MLIEFQKKDSVAFDEVMAVLKRYPNFENVSFKEETVISIPGLTIYPEQRKIYRDRQEIHLTAKEYEILRLLVSNRGQILTYGQIYEKVWGGISYKNENKAIRYHIHHLREKLNATFSWKVWHRVWHVDEPWSNRYLSGDGGRLAGQGGADMAPLPKPEVDEVSSDRLKIFTENKNSEQKEMV